GATGQAGQTGATGPTGQTGPAGTAVAYAHIAADGTVSQSSGNITATRVNSGVYCVEVTGAFVHVAVVSLDSGPNVGGSVQAGGSSASACPNLNGTGDIFVLTRPQSQDGGIPGADRAFYIIAN